MKAPAFQFYPERWLAGTAHLSPAARGIYIDLLCWSWSNDRPLPRSAEARCQIARVTSLETFNALWTEIADKWDERPDGYENAALERVRSSLEAFVESQREKGRRSAAKRWGRPDATEPGHQLGYRPGHNPASEPGDEPGYQPDGNSRISDLGSPISDFGSRWTDSAAPSNGATPAARGRGPVEARHAKPVDDSPVVLTFPTVGPVQEWQLTERQIAEWTALYPTLDILAEAQKALAWVRATPGRRKTAGGMARFLVSWLNRSADSRRSAMADPLGRAGKGRRTSEAFDVAYDALTRRQSP